MNRTRCSRAARRLANIWLLGSAAVAVPFVSVSADPGKSAPRRLAPATDLFPLSPEEMADEHSLAPRIITDTAIAPRRPGQPTLRWLEVRFYSHQWKDGPWHGKVRVVIPRPIRNDRRGLVVMCPIGSSHVQAGVDIERDFFEETARRFGIPVVSIPNMGEHFGYSKIHPMSDHLIMKYLESGDPSWIPGYTTCAVRSRALTLVGRLTGHPVRKAIHLGSSISAHQAWIWPLCDSRVVSLIATGDVGFHEDKYPSDGTFRRAGRPVFAAISRASSELRDGLLDHTDAYRFGSRMQCSILQIAGTNDFASPPSTVDRFLSALAGPTHLVNVPNYAHGCGSRRHVTALHMWIDHVFFQRPLTSIDEIESCYTSGKVTVTATLKSTRLNDARARFVFATSSEPRFLRSRFLKTTPRNNHVLAKWKTVQMQRINSTANQWRATIEFPRPVPRFVAGFVDVADRGGKTAGYAASRMLWLEDGQSAPPRP